ncbi:MAG: hypothetical protein ASARMPREDX12_003674 [Alectoria sarmentosa]|nr:MAG: hypothetical protein ASARMPREDX12_003674 [Alectoria sarmentosa]
MRTHLLRRPALGQRSVFPPPANTYPARSRYTWGDYFALSYAWGDPNDTREIFVDGQVCHVTKNLEEEALRTLREHEVIRAGYQLWIDSLCINQNNVPERSQQGRRMHEIYGTALDVLVWLGNEKDGSEMAIDFVNALSGCWDAGREEDLQRKLRRELYSRDLGLWRALHQLTERSYWRRLWVTQELILGTSDMLVVCGERTSHWQDLYHVLYYFNDPAEDRVFPIVRRELRHTGERNEKLSEKKLYWGWANVTEINALRDMTPLPDLMTLFTFIRHKEATDPRDMIYGSLGLMEGSFSRRVKPDYDASVQDVFLGFAREWIGGTSNLEILGQCDGTAVPSWCPDWNMRPYRHLHAALEPRYDSSARSKAVVHFSEDGQYLTCKGLRIDSVDGMTTAMLLDVNERGSERQIVLKCDVCDVKNGFNYSPKAPLEQAVFYIVQKYVAGMATGRRSLGNQPIFQHIGPPM